MVGGTDLRIRHITERFCRRTSAGQSYNLRGSQELTTGTGNPASEKEVPGRDSNNKKGNQITERQWEGEGTERLEVARAATTGEPPLRNVGGGAQQPRGGILHFLLRES